MAIDILSLDLSTRILCVILAARSKERTDAYRPLLRSKKYSQRLVHYWIP